LFFFSSRRRHTRFSRDWSSDVCSSDLAELITARSIEPHTTEALSAEAHGNRALLNTEWKMGNVDFKGVRTITFEDYTNPYAYLKIGRASCRERVMRSLAEVGAEKSETT